MPRPALRPSAFTKAPWKQFIYNWLCAPLWGKRNERKGPALSVQRALYPPGPLYGLANVFLRARLCGR